MHDTHGSEEQDKQIRCLKPMKENVLHCTVFQKPTKLDGISRNNTAYVTLFTVTRLDSHSKFFPKSNTLLKELQVLRAITNLRHKQLSNFVSFVHGNIVKPLSIDSVDLISPLPSVVDWQPWLLLHRPSVTRCCHATLYFDFSRLFFVGARFLRWLVRIFATNYRKFCTRCRL